MTDEVDKIDIFADLVEIEKKLEDLYTQIATTKDNKKKLDLKTRANILEDMKDYNLAKFFDCGVIQ